MIPKRLGDDGGSNKRKEGEELSNQKPRGKGMVTVHRQNPSKHPSTGNYLKG